MTDIRIETQYSTGASPQTIKQALVAAGKDPGHLRPADLALLEDFRTMGRIATIQLADLAEITPDDEVLDAGSGIGGTARYLAERSRCYVAAMDLTAEYCETARWLNQLVGLDDRISVRQGDVTDHERSETCRHRARTAGCTSESSALLCRMIMPGTQSRHGFVTNAVLVLWVGFLLGPRLSPISYPAQARRLRRHWAC